MRKEKMRVRIDYAGCRLFDEKINSEEIGAFTKKVKKKLR